VKHGLFIFCFLLFSGCVASDSFARKNAKNISRLSEITSGFFKGYARENPENQGAQYYAEESEKINDSIQKHAKSDSRPFFIQAAQTGIGGYLQGGGIMGAISGLGMLYLRKRSTEKMRSLCDDLTNETDVEKCKAIRKGVI